MHGYKSGYKNNMKIKKNYKINAITINSIPVEDTIYAYLSNFQIHNIT